jgi:glutaredoxin
MKLIIYSLIGCPYSMKSEKLLEKYQPKIIKVNYNEKEQIKRQNNMPTFPQIFLEDGDKKIKIGGFDDTVSLLRKIFNKQEIEYSKEESEKLKKFFLNIK